MDGSQYCRSDNHDVGFLCVTTALSLYDGFDNFSRRPHDPIAATSWLWLLFVDLPMPILAILLGVVRRQRDHMVAELSRLSVSDQLTALLNLAWDSV